MEPSIGRLGVALRSTAILLGALDIALLAWLLGTHRFSAGTTLLIINGLAIMGRLVGMYFRSARGGPGGPTKLA